MKRTILILAAIAIVLGVVVLVAPIGVYRFFNPPNRAEVIQRVFKDDEVFGVMTNSPQVTAQRLHVKSDGDQTLLNGYTRGTPVPLTAEQAQNLKSLLQSPRSYLWGVGSCLPNYGVVYNFQSGTNTVHVAFCFKCNIVGVFDGDNDSSNSVNFTSQFDPMRGQMIALSKTLFPNDKEIQVLH